MIKRTNITLPTLAIALAITSAPSIADDNKGQAYAGLKFGSFQVDVEGVDNSTPIGFQLGYDLGDTLSFEVEYNKGSGDVDFGFAETEYDMTTMAIYATFRSKGKGYFLAKAGLIKEEIEIGSISEDDTGLSYGFGGGFKLNDNIALEAEFTIVEEDANYIGATARFLF